MPVINNNERRNTLISYLSSDYQVFYILFDSQNNLKILTIRVNLFPDSFRFEIINQDKRIIAFDNNWSVYDTKNGLKIRISGDVMINENYIDLLDEGYSNNFYEKFNSKNQRNEFILIIYDALEDFAKNYQGFEENIKPEPKKLTHEEIITQAINKIDLKTHLDKFLEESTELNHDILQKKDFATELVDVEIVLECLKRYIVWDKYEDLKDKAYNKFYNQLEKLDNIIITSAVQCPEGVEQ